MSLETKHIFASGIQAGEAVADVFFLASAQQGQAKNGPYWRLVLQDSSGNIEAKIWSPLSLEHTVFDLGEPYWLAARAKSYRDKSELVISSIRPLGPEEKMGLDLKDFLVTSPHDADAMLASLAALCAQHVTHPPLRRFLDLLLGDEAIRAGLKMAPAAKAMHHAYAGGLLEHTLSVCTLAMKICDHYPNLDRQILLAGALCHDLGKMWELSSGMAIDYTDAGRLLGHITLGLDRLQPLLAASGLDSHICLHLQHLVVSHHGTLEFGSPRVPATAEALVLHYADNIDAKMQQVGNALASLGEAQSGWSAYVTGLERFVYRATITPPGQGSGQETGAPAPLEVCSLDAGEVPLQTAPAEVPFLDDFYASPDASYEAIALAGKYDADDSALDVDCGGYFAAGGAQNPYGEPAADAPAVLAEESTASPAKTLEDERSATPQPLLVQPLEQAAKKPAAPLPLIQQCSLLSKE